MVFMQYFSPMAFFLVILIVNDIPYQYLDLTFTILQTFNFTMVFIIIIQIFNIIKVFIKIKTNFIVLNCNFNFTFMDS